MTNQEKPQPQKDNAVAKKKSDQNKINVPVPNVDSISLSINTSGSDNSQAADLNQASDHHIGNCPACGFGYNREPAINRSTAANGGICPDCHNPLDPSSSGYFVVYRDEHDPFDIAYQWVPAQSAAAIPADKLTLFKTIVTANTIIKSLYFSADSETDKHDQNHNNSIKKKYFKKLLSLAQAGLVGEMAQPELAETALERLKDEITTVEGQRIKNTYMKELGLRAFLFILSAMIIFLLAATGIFSDDAALANLLLKKTATAPLLQSGVLAVVSMCCVIWIGAMLGTWVSFAARNPAIEFSQLSILETDRISPTIRLIYIGLCAIIFALFLSSGIVALAVGGFSTANIASSINTQFVIGLLCGLTESKIGSFIHQKSAAAILNNKPIADQPAANQPPS